MDSFKKTKILSSILSRCYASVGWRPKRFETCDNIATKFFIKMAAIFRFVCHGMRSRISFQVLFLFLSFIYKEEEEEGEESWQQAIAMAATANGSSLCDTRHRFTASRFLFTPQHFYMKKFFHFDFFNLNLNGLSNSAYHSRSYVSQKIFVYVFKMDNIISNRSWRTCKKSVDDDDPIWPLGLFFIPP